MKKINYILTDCSRVFAIAFLLLTVNTVVSFAQDKKKEKPAARSKKYSAPSYKSSSGASSKDAIEYEQAVEERKLDIKEADEVSDKNPEKAVEILENTLKSSIKSGDAKSEAESYQVLGEVNLNKGIYNLAIRNFERANSIYTENGDQQPAMEVTYSLALAYAGQGNTKEAIQQLNIYSMYGDKQNNNAISLKGRYKLGEIYMSDKKWQQALSVYQQILSLEKEAKRPNAGNIASVNNKIGQIYGELNQSKQALGYLNAAQTIAESSNNTVILSDINKNIGNELVKSNNYEENLANHLRALQLTRKAGDKESEIKENLAVASAYLYLKKVDESIRYNSAALDLSKRLKNSEQIAEAYRYLAYAYLEKKNVALSSKNYKEYLLRKDSLIAEKQAKVEKMLSSNISLAENQKHIELLEKDIELNQKTIEALTSEKEAKEERLSGQRTVIYSLIAGLLLVIVAAYIVYKNSQKRRIANQLLALKSLRSQMNPHFIFNALNSVNSFISKNDERSANKYLADFSRLMRMVMENSQHDFIHLSQEVEILELYLLLEHYRFQDKFSYSLDVARDIDTDSFDIPPMLIQPYIENAVWHGLRYKEEKGFLKVTITSQSASLLKIRIEDNGIGREKSAELKTHNQKTTKSTGIKNTESRVGLINELFGENLSVQIDDFDTNAEDTGTVVTILVPVFGKTKV